jgi:hypothetical protein
MPFHEHFQVVTDTADRDLWIAGHITTRGAEIIIPAAEVEAMTDTDLCLTIRSLVLPARIADGFYCHYSHMLSQVGREYVEKWKDYLREGLKHPFYADRHQELEWGLQLADEALSGIADIERQNREDEERQRAKEAKANGPNRGYVYLVKSPTGTYKIGRAKNPWNRVKTFGVKLPFEVELIHLIECEQYHDVEANLHARFASKRVNGSEFFALTDEDVAYIKSIERM